jgi:hypothetical protein
MDKWHLLSPRGDVCQKCAVDHDQEMPHDKTSLYYQYWFRGQHGRWPTWSDALADCTDDVKEAWTEVLKRKGIDLHDE